MEIVLDKKGSTAATLKVTIKADDYQPIVKNKLKEYGKKVSLKGFRQGKVPTSVVERMYGKSLKVDEINQLLTQSVSKYIKDEKLNIIGFPLPDQAQAAKIDWENASEYEFFYDLGLIPEFKYELSDKVNVSKYEIQVDPKRVAETLDNIRRQQGKMDEAEKVEEGDYVNGELKSLTTEFATSTMIPTEKVEKAELKKFIGKKTGDVIEFDIDKAFTDKSSIAHVTGLTKEEAETTSGKFSFTITGIRRSFPAEINQEFFDKIFGPGAVASEEEFNKKLEETIAQNYNREAEVLVSRDVRKEFLANTKVEISEAFLKRFLLVNNEGKISAEQIDKDLNLYQDDLKWLLIRNKIGEDNDVKVEHSEVIQRTKELFMQQFGGMTSLSEEMEETMNKLADNYLSAENGKNYNRTFEEVYYNKVLKLIESKISFKTKKISVDEFEKLVQAN
ncbi:trigger factor [Cytophaga aurantiaca]|uniref:trigger factor n=1 Tax=Cytophaga aurantiaca TaxID=29530 RepID=UPI00037030CB|nr:trigger factor [Cytophaga aurantiaca]